MGKLLHQNKEIILDPLQWSNCQTLFKFANYPNHVLKSQKFIPESHKACDRVFQSGATPQIFP